MIGRLQDMIKESSLIVSPNVRMETKETNKKFDIINQIDNEFKDKSEKIKVLKCFQNFFIILIGSCSNILREIWS